MNITIDMPKPKVAIRWDVYRKRLPTRCHTCGAADWRIQHTAHCARINRIVKNFRCRNCGHHESVYTDEPVPEPAPESSHG